MNLAIVGCGMMGSLIKEMAEDTSGIERIYSVEPAKGETLFYVPACDVIIDFSHPNALADICDYVKERSGKTGVVFGTTGFSDIQRKKIQALGEVAPVVSSYNYSYGIHALKQILGCAVKLLDARADIEIIEKHHNLKVDAPSGTALMLADICDPKGERKRLYGRQGEGVRGDEIGMHSIRGGTIFGEHSIIFALEDEVIALSHTAFSKKIFAKGALDAALWLNGKKRGIYTLEDVFY